MTSGLDPHRTELSEFGRRLRERRESRNLTLRVAAAQLDIDAGQMSRIENGVWMPSEELEAALVEWMG